MNAIDFKKYDATLWLYLRLCEKECANGRLSEEEFVILKDLFMSLTLQAKDLMNNFYQYECGVKTDSLEVIIDHCANRIIYYPNRWKTMYNGLRRRIEEERIVRNDRTRNLHSPRYLLPTLNSHLAACWCMKQAGKTYKENQELFNKMYHYLSSDAPLVNKYPGISIVEQVNISEVVLAMTRNDDIDYEREFQKSIKQLMGKRGLEFSLTPSPQIADMVQGPPWGFEFKNEIERKVLMALNQIRDIEFIYFSFKDGCTCTSYVRTTPVGLRYDGSHWTLIGQDMNHIQYEYNMRLILSVDENEVQKFK